LVELEQLRVKHEKLKAVLSKAGAAASSGADQPAKKKKKAKDSSDSGSSSDSEGEEDVGELPTITPMAAGTVAKRTSVSAEVYGKFNKKEEYVPYVVAKS